jgi:hypothetical protein
MKTVKNEYTGVNEIHFDAKVISIGDTVLENSNGTEYVVSTVEFVDRNNKTQRASAILYTKALEASKLEIGATTNCRALPPRDGETTVLLILDPIQATQRAEANMFAFEAVPAADVPA